MPLSNLQTRAVETLIHPYSNQATIRDTGPLVLERGKGVYVYDTDGKPYLEGMAGLWCTALGYDNEELVEAAATQMRKLPFAHLFTAKSHDPAIELAEKLKEIAPVPISKVFFCNSGSEANDSQMKLVWYMNNALGRPNKKKIISRVKAYHGVTIAAASLTGLPNNHIDFDLPIARVLHTSCPHHYRFAKDGESEEDFATRLAAELEELILREGPDTVAAFIAEPVMGAGGVIVPPKTYFPKIMAVCAKYDVFMIDDEVICGFGRLGAMFGCTTLGFKPNSISVAKALSSAYHADRRRHDPRGDVSGADRREQKDRHLRPRLHLFGPSGVGRGRGEDAGDLPARQDRREGGSAQPAIPEAAERARRSSAGRRGARDGIGRRASSSPRTRRARRRSMRSRASARGSSPMLRPRG